MPLIIPIFVMNQGCPHRCVFCNISKIAGHSPDEFSEETLLKKVEAFLEKAPLIRTDCVQIAFYGGSFTGMQIQEQIRFLQSVSSFIKNGSIDSIRVSIRPDHINNEICDVLTSYKVKTIEVGAQSMSDHVLSMSQRGHSSADVENSLTLLKERGFETGVHLMVGLPGDTRESFEESVDRIISLRPDFVRIHPTIIFRDTLLYDLYISGSYVPLELTEAIDICKSALLRFEEAKIRVIRLGLQGTPEMNEKSVVAGPFHPAFRSLVESSIYLDIASSMLASHYVKNMAVTFYVHTKDISSFRGQKNENLRKLKDFFGLSAIYIKEDPLQTKRSVAMKISDN